MQKIIRNINDTRQALEIILSAGEFGPEYNHELEEARRNIQIKGFRKGHAPVSLIKKMAGPSIEAGVAEKMASQYFGEIVEAEGINPVGRAAITGYSFEGEELKIELEFDVQPEFELADFSGYTFTKARYTVTEADIDNEVKRILKGNGTLVSIDEPASSTDTVIGDVWRLNEAGEPDEALKTENHHFSLEYLPEDNPFRQGLTGKKAGESVDIENKESDTQPSRFRVLISEIKRLELPELTDELVAEISTQKFKSIAEFRNDLQNQLSTHYTKRAEEELLEAMSEKLIEANPLPTPESMVESFSNMLLDNTRQQIGGSFPKNFNEKGFRETLRPNAVKHAQWLMITRKLAEMGNISVSEDDLKAYIEKEAERHPGIDKEKLLESYKTSELSEYLTEVIFKEKVYDFLKSKVTITEEEKAIPASTEDEE